MSCLCLCVHEVVQNSSMMNKPAFHTYWLDRKNAENSCCSIAKSLSVAWSSSTYGVMMVDTRIAPRGQRNFPYIFVSKAQ